MDPLTIEIMSRLHQPMYTSQTGPRAYPQSVNIRHRTYADMSMDRNDPVYTRAKNGLAISSIATDKRGNVYVAKSMEFGDWHVLKDQPELQNQTSCIELYSQDDLTRMVAKRQFRTSDRERIQNLVVSASGDLYFVSAKMKWGNSGNYVTTICHLPPFAKVLTIELLDKACSSKLIIDCLGLVQEYLCGKETKETMIPDIETAIMSDLWLQPLSKDVYSILTLVMDETRRYLYAHAGESIPDKSCSFGSRLVRCIRFWDTMYDVEPSKATCLVAESPSNVVTLAPETANEMVNKSQPDQVLSIPLDLVREHDVKKHGKYAFGHETDLSGTDADCIDVQQHGTCLYFSYDHTSFGNSSMSRFASWSNKPGSVIESRFGFQDLSMHHTESGSDGWRCFVGEFIWLWNSKTDQVRKFDNVQYRKYNAEYNGYACFADDGKRIIASTNDREHFQFLSIDQAEPCAPKVGDTDTRFDFDSTSPMDYQSCESIFSFHQQMPLVETKAENKLHACAQNLDKSIETKIEVDTIKIKNDKRVGECKNCHKSSVTKRCGRCHTTFYCNEECQRADWQRHKADDCCKGVPPLRTLHRGMLPL